MSSLYRSIRANITLPAFKIAAIYVLFAMLWIILSDQLTDAIIADRSLSSSVQTIKGIFFVVLTASLIYILVKRSFKVQRHLNSVLTMIRDVDQLIVREKDVDKLLQESCEILTSAHIYGCVWISLLDEDRTGSIYGTVAPKPFSHFQEKVRQGWTPHCIDKTNSRSEPYSTVQDTMQECHACPLHHLYQGKSALDIALRHGDRMFGYLTIALERHYLADPDEITLLQEVAGDIAYALHNLENDKKSHQRQELYDDIINSVDNLIFVKDTDLDYIACNKAFETFMGRSKDEIIGKDDYAFFERSIAEAFRANDRKTLDRDKPRSDFEWVVDDSGRRVYLQTSKSPLIDSAGNVFGLVGNSADITEQAEIERTLQASNEKFEKAFNKTPNLILITHLKNSKIYDVNQTFCQRFGYRKEELLGKTTFDIHLWVHQEDRKAYIDTLQENGSVDGALYTFHTREGEEVITQVFSNLITIEEESYILAVGDDITEKVTIHRRLEQQKRELETIIQEAPNPIMLFDEDGKVLMVNKVWERSTGYRLDEIDTIERWTAKAHGKDAPTIKKHIESLFTSKEAVDTKGEYPIRTREGRIIIWQFKSAYLGIIDSRRTMISSAMDITELKQKDAMLIEQSRHAAMGEMIAMIAHQWRQPLSVISMNANNMLLDLALDESHADSIEKASQSILAQTADLSKTIDDFRNFFRPDKAVSKVKMERVLEETYSIVEASLKDHDIRLRTFIDSHTEVDAFHRELMQVLVNIITNAKDALVMHKVQTPLIEVRVFDDQEYVNTEICDNGGGIDKTILSKVFDPYFSTKEEMTGTGLGLYMSKMIIEDHLHGRIEVSSDKHGACFIVRLRKPKS